MTEEIAKTASQLLKEKSELIDDLSKIMDKPKSDGSIYDSFYCFVLAYGYNGGFMFHAQNPSLNVNKYDNIREKVKNLLISEINIKITEIDEQLKNLTC